MRIYFYVALVSISIGIVFYFVPRIAPPMVVSEILPLNYPRSSPLLTADLKLKKDTKEDDQQGVFDEKKYKPEDLIAEQIKKIEVKLQVSSAIDRLNKDTVTAQERAELFKQFKKLDELRAQLFDLKLAALEKDVAQVELELPSRLQAYGVQR